MGMVSVAALNVYVLIDVSVSTSKNIRRYFTPKHSV